MHFRNSTFVALLGCLTMAAQSLAQAQNTQTKPSIKAPQAASAPVARTGATPQIHQQGGAQPPALTAQHAQDGLSVPGGPSNTLWVRYLQAGEISGMRNDPALKKRYLMGALSELEKHPTKPKSGNGWGNAVSLKRLKRDLMQQYPKDWSKFEGNKQDELNLRREQLTVLRRLARLDEVRQPRHKSVQENSKKKYDTALRDYNKALSSAGRQG